MKKKIKALLSMLIAVSILVPTIVLPVSAETIVETTGAVDAMEAISAAFDDTYLIESHSQADDGYIGIPVDVKVYFNKNIKARSGYHGTPLIVYVVNTNTERIGTESDVSIMTRWLEKDWIVAVVDYKNNVRAASPELDYSVQELRNKIYIKGNYLTASNFQSGTYWDDYVLPAGYDIRLNDIFWEADKHSAAGTLEEIVKFWNTDLKGAAPDVYVNWTYKDANGNTVRKEVTDDGVWYKDTAGNIDMENGVYTKVKYTVVNDITDCSNKDGSPLDLNLYITFKYPTNPVNEVPVMAMHSCQGYMPKNGHALGKPHFVGSLFNGYAGIIYDYLYNPICRDDGVAFVAGSSAGGVTGDSVNYSLDLWNDKIINTAAMRYIRYVDLAEPETFKFDTDHIGVVGVSKSGTHPFLGEAILRAPLIGEEEAAGLTNEDLEKKINEKLTSFTPMRFYEGHSGETRYQNGELDSYTSSTTGVTIDGGELQPWLTYNGEELLSGAHFIHCACPNGEEDITEGHAPTFLAIQLNDGWWTPDYGTAGDFIRLCRTHDIPSVWVAVEQGHGYASGPDVTTNIDTYDAYTTLAAYYLKGTPIEALYTLPLDKSLDVSVTSDIIIKFAGEVYREEIEKITIKSESGDILTGSWSSLFGNTEWTFKPDNAMKSGERYTLTAPASLKGSNGKAMGEEYTSSFVTEREAAEAATVDGFEITATVPDLEETSKGGYINDMKLRFYVPTEGAANTAEVYAEGKLLGTVPLKGKGHYSLDVSDYLETKNAGDAVTFTIKQKREAGVYDHYEETYDSGKGNTTVLDRSDYEVTTFDSRSALKVWIDIDKCFFKKNPFYMSPADLIKNDKLIENGRVLTADDYGRRFNISLDVYDDISRRIMMYPQSCDTPKTYRVFDVQSPQYNFTTSAGEWKTLSFDYTVYDSDYGKAGEHAQSLKIELFPDGVKETPVYIDNIKVTEIVTDFEIEKAEIACSSNGSYSYKVAEADKPFAIYQGEEKTAEYDSWSEVLSAYSAGNTIKLQKNYVFTDADAFSSFDSFESVDIDMNGYVIYSENKNNSLLWLKTTKTGNTEVNISNGTVFLKNTPLISYASSTTAGSGKKYDINLDNVNIILNEDFVSYNVISDKTITNGVSVNTDITLTDCNIEAKNDAMETWDVTVFSSGDGSLTSNYIIKGGAFNIDFFKKIKIYDSAENTTFCADDDGAYTVLNTPANVIVEETSYKTDKGYRNFITNDTGDGRYTYTLEKTELSTLYGIIPSQYSSTELYPFAVFNANGEFVIATNNYGTNDTSALQKAKGAGDGAVILLRRDFDLEESGTFMNLSQVNGTMYLDLNGFTMNMVSDAFFMHPQAKTNNSTTVVVKNGTLRTKKTALIRMASWANTAYTQKKEYVLDFENVTFGFSEGASGVGNMITTAYTGGDDPESHVSINLYDCIIDLETNAPSGKYTIFGGIDSLNHIETDINIAGGRIIADSLANTTLSNLSASNGSSLLLSKGTNGAYPELLVKQPETGVFGDVLQTSEDGYKVYSATENVDENGYYECTLDGDIIATEYGAVSPEYAEKNFVAFSGGKAIFADDNFYDGTTSIYNKAKAYLQSNSTNADGSMGENAQEIQVVLMKDHTMPETVYVNLSQLKGKMTLDLGGNTLTLANAVPMFNAQGKSWGTHGLFETEFLVKNGNIAVGNKGLISYHTWKSVYTGSIGKQFTFNFDNVNFSIRNGSAPTDLVKFQSDTNDLPGNYDISFNNCNFDLTNATANLTLFGANHDSCKIIKVNYEITGGSIYAADMSELTLTSFGNSLATINFNAAEENGLYTLIKLPFSSSTPTGDIKAGDKTLRYVEYETNDGIVTYAPGVVTEYGVIPPQYAGRTFIIFQDGEFKYASDNLYLSGNDTTSAIYLVKQKLLQNNKNLVNADGSLKSGAKEAQIVMLKDHTAEAVGYTNIAQVQGKVTIDLNGHTLSQNKTFPIFALQAKKWWHITDTNIVVKNGTIDVQNASIINYYTYGAEAETATKRYVLDFENINFVVNGSADKLVYYNPDDRGTLSADYDITFTDCTFDLRNTTKKFTLCNATHNINETEPITVDYKLVGGNIIAKTADSFEFSSFTGTGEATLEYEKGANELYTTLTLPETATAPTITVDVNGTSKTYSEYKQENGYKSYKLIGEAEEEEENKGIETEYGTIPLEWTDKAFVAFTGGQAFAASDKMYGNTDSIMNSAKSYMEKNKIKDVQILLRKEYGNVENYMNLSQINGKVLLDLGGHSIFVYYNIFNAQSKSYYGIFDTDIMVKNGKIKFNFNNSVISYQTYGTGDGNTKRWGFHFEDVDFSFENSKGASIASYSTSDQKTIPSIYDITFTNCNFDMTNAPAGFTLFKANHEANPDIRVNYTVKGGSIKAPSMDGFKIVDLGNSNASFKYEATAEAPYYTTIVLPEDAQAPTETVTIDGNEYSRYAYAGADGYVTYALGKSTTTKYGTVPAEYALKSFAAFLDGEFLFAHDELYGASNTGIYHLAKEYLKNNSVNADGTMAEGADEIDVILLKDASMSQATVGYSNMAQLKGKLTIDLDGHTLTQFENETIFNACAKPWGTYGMFDTNVIMKNGTLVLNNGYLITYNTWGSTYTGTVKKHMTLEFEDMDIVLSEGYSRSALITYVSTNNLTPIDSIFDISFKNCDFDVTKATSEALTILKANHPEAGTSLDYRIEGGSIKANTANMLTVADLGDSNAAIEFVTNSESGDYTTLILPENVAEPKEVIDVNGEMMRYTKASSSGSNTIYKLSAVTECEILDYDLDGKEAELLINADGTYVVVFADYNGDTLAGIDVEEATLSKGIQSVEQKSDFTPDKIMLMNSLTDMTPLCEPKRVFTIMAIGNSFAQDSAFYLDDVAAADGVVLKSYNAMIGGRTLGEHCDSWDDETDPYGVQINAGVSIGNMTLKSLAEMSDWDYVILQGTTHNISSDNSSRYDDAFWGVDNETAEGSPVDSAAVWTSLKDNIEATVPGAERLVHATWAPYEAAAEIYCYSRFADGVPDSRGAMTAKILERAQLGADIYSTEKRHDGEGAFIPTAVAVDYLIRHYGFPEYEGELDENNRFSQVPDVRGVYRDKTCHLSANVGRVLASLVWYEMITGTPATENNYERVTLSSEDMAKIKEAAHYACENYMNYDPEKVEAA